MKRRIVASFSVLSLVLILVVFSFAVGCQKAEAPAVIELRYNTINSDVHMLEVEVFQPLWNKIEQSTEGRVKVTPYYNATLTSIGETYSSILTGRADIANIYTAGSAGVLPLSEVIVFAPLDSSTDKPSVIFWELFQKFPALQAEYSNVKVLSTPSTPQQNIVCVKKDPPLSLDDLKGFKMCSAGGWVAERADALGCSTISVPIVDLYDAADKGVMDGILFGWGDYFPFRLDEVAPNVLEVNFGYTPYLFAMSLDAWNKIQPQDQKKIDELCGRNLAEQIDALWWRHITEGQVAQAISTGKVKVYDVPDEELVKWSAAEKHVRDKWVSEMAKTGVQAEEILDEFDRLLEQYSVK